MFDRDITKGLVIRDFDDVLKNPFSYVILFLLHTSLSKAISFNGGVGPSVTGLAWRSLKDFDKCPLSSSSPT